MGFAPSSGLGGRHLVSPTKISTVESHTILRNRWWKPLMVEAGLVTDDGKLHFSFHKPRHAAASLWIEMGLRPKRIQKLIGHAALQMTIGLRPPRARPGSRQPDRPPNGTAVGLRVQIKTSSRPSKINGLNP
ncbi:tyrosine-type recombinase/integrase [Azospirillum baldaniorum]|uniref:tyrosine-type recombinase/integrase n=1 Tax=Azospirillum baldaniorum TaxID=1064539 RepID=UPI003CC832A6